MRRTLPPQLGSEHPVINIHPGENRTCGAAQAVWRMGALDKFYFGFDCTREPSFKTEIKWRLCPPTLRGRKEPRGTHSIFRQPHGNLVRRNQAQRGPRCISRFCWARWKMVSSSISLFWYRTSRSPWAVFQFLPELQVCEGNIFHPPWWYFSFSFSLRVSDLRHIFRSRPVSPVG